MTIRLSHIYCPFVGLTCCRSRYGREMLWVRTIRERHYVVSEHLFLAHQKTTFSKRIRTANEIIGTLRTTRRQHFRKEHKTNMTFIRPTKLIIKLPILIDQETTMCPDCNAKGTQGEKPMQRLDEYNLFLILEMQRNKNLKDLYRGNRPLVSKKSRGDTTLLKFPPRYQCRDLTAEWIVSEMKRQRRDSSIHSPSKEQWTTGLDQVTKTFLSDTVNVLKDQYFGTTQIRPSNPPLMPSQGPTTITPHSTPLLSPLSSPPVAPEDSISFPHELPESRRDEVDMSDEEIISLWTHATPSEDGVDLDECEVSQ